MGLIRLPRGRGLQLEDRTPDRKPDALPVVLAAFEHLIGSPACHDLGVHTMFADDRVRSCLLREAELPIIQAGS